MKEVVDALLTQKGTGKDAVIPVLQALQKQYNYLPEEALQEVCEGSDITRAEAIGVASFYSQFRFQPAGKHLVKVCVGTACHVKGAGLVYDAISRNLELSEGQDTDKKREFTLQKVSCLGCCTLAPVVQIDGVTYGHIKPSMVGEVIEDFKRQSKAKASGRSVLFKKDVFQGEIRLGLGSCCVASGSDDVRQAVETVLERNQLNVDIKQVGCVGMCHQVPLVEVVPDGKPAKLYAKVSPSEVKDIVEHHFKPVGLRNKIRLGLTNLVESLQQETEDRVVEKYTIDIREKHVHAFLGNQKPIATEHRGIISPLNLDEYLKHGGFEGLKKALSRSPWRSRFPHRQKVGAGGSQRFGRQIRDCQRG